MIFNKRFINTIAIGAIACGMILFNCSMKQIKTPELAKTCTHCHGSELEGVKSIKMKCTECHELTPLAPREVSSADIKKAMTEQPHPHKTRNLFTQTPSCYLCHRKTDFNGVAK